MAELSSPANPAWPQPLEHELALLKRWRRRVGRSYVVAGMLLALALVALTGWALSDSTYRDLLIGKASPVTASVTGVERAGACASRWVSVPRYRYDVSLTDPGDSGLAAGSANTVEACTLHRTGTSLSLTAVEGQLTNHDPTWARMMVGLTAAGALFFAGLLWFFRRQGGAMDRLIDDGGPGTPLKARLVSSRLGWYADTGTQMIRLGLPLITPDQRLLAWRFRRVPLRDGAEIGLLLFRPPFGGDPVLLVDEAGSRQWRTLR